MLTGELPGSELQPASRKVQFDVRLDEIVLRALEVNPERRHATAGEFRTHLKAIAIPVRSKEIQPHPTRGTRHAEANSRGVAISGLGRGQ